MGILDEEETFENAAIDKAAMVVATDDDIRNVNIAFRARDASPELTVVSTCNRSTSEEILSLAGASHVIRSAKQMGSFLARRISCTDNNTHLIGSFDEVQIAEATIHGTPLVGQELKDTNLRDEFGVNVVGMWERVISNYRRQLHCLTITLSSFLPAEKKTSRDMMRNLVDFLIMVLQSLLSGREESEERPQSLWNQ